MFSALAISLLAVRVACFGDSVTAGYGVEPEQSWCSIVGGLNFGIGGNNTRDGLARIDSVIESKPRVVLISFGLNDAINYAKGTIPVEQYRKNLEAIIRTFRRSGIKPILQTGTPTTDVTVNAIFKPYVEAQRQIARRKNIPLVENYTAFAEALIEGQPLYMDYGHPDAAGHALIASKVLRTLKQQGKR
jgi:acyl-CoA thioesterase-1